MKLGNYRIGQNVSEIENELTEVSSSEYRILGRSFKDERIFHGRDVEYLGVNWKPIIGVAGGRVYKVSLQTNRAIDLKDALKTPPLADYLGGRKPQRAESDIWGRAYDDLIKDYGIFTGQQRGEGGSLFTIWDREWGNIILTLSGVPGGSHGDILKFEAIIDIAFTGNFPFKKSKFWKKVFQNGN